MSDSALRVLVIAAHADDIEFGVAGSVAAWVDAGAQVTYCLVTDGAAGSNEPGADLAALAEQRVAEQMAAAAHVGVHDVRFLNYADGTLQPTLDLRRDLTRVIRQVRPQRVVIYDPTAIYMGDFYINHPDHRAAGEAALYAVFPSAGTRPIFPELLAEGLEPHDIDELWITMSDKPDTWVDTTTTVERKVAALLEHRSQVGPDVGDMVRKWDSETGAEKGFAYAESFRVMKFNREPQKDPHTAESAAEAEAVAE